MNVFKIEKMDREQLLQICKIMNIKASKKHTKAQLITKLLKPLGRKYMMKKLTVEPSQLQKYGMYTIDYDVVDPGYIWNTTKVEKNVHVVYMGKNTKGELGFVKPNLTSFQFITFEQIRQQHGQPRVVRKTEKKSGGMYHTFDWIDENSWNEKDWKKFEFSLETYYDYNSECQSVDLHNYSLYVAPANIKEIKEGWENLPEPSAEQSFTERRRREAEEIRRIEAEETDPCYTYFPSKINLKQQYHNLARIHHPDKGGNKETFQTILDCYKNMKNE